ncbi:C-C motif chemokine 13-like [Colossoma macropomum]|uniref:C-C motif chemokine 13-like n=1 Tax=Colossoma macropomum TaxID=42526 RepID=UPI0018647287|nr:C-C motif chemokine 13-like [Colossoma macropomum]
MRILSALLVLLLLCSLQLTSSAPACLCGCCPHWTNMEIPLDLVESYTWTPDECHTKAIIFHTKKGKTLCVDPDSVWVRSYIAALDKRTHW